MEQIRNKKGKFIKGHRGFSVKMGIIKQCIVCQKEFYNSLNGNKKFCSHKCYSKNKKGKKHNWGNKISKSMKGKKKTKQHIENVAKALRGTKRPSITGNKHPNWKGGEEITDTGYKLVYCPNHPNAKNNKILEHRLIMERFLGRILNNDEVVHHINGIKNDNRIENLMIMTREQHMNHHLKEILIGLKKDIKKRIKNLK